MLSNADRFTPHRGRLPYAVDNRVPWDTLTERQRDQVRAWLAGLGIQPDRVPVGGLVKYDPRTHEWRIEVLALRDGRPNLRPTAPVAPGAQRHWRHATQWETVVIRRRDPR